VASWFRNKYNQDRLMLWIVVPLMAIPFIYPLGLPIPISPDSIEAFEYLDNVPNGAVLVMGEQAGLANWFELAPVTTVVYKHAFNLIATKGVKIIMVGATFEAATIVRRVLEQNVKPDELGAVYGVDYIDLGWVPGGEPMLRGIVTDMLGIIPTDYQGTILTTLPLIQGLVADDGLVNVKDYDYMYFCITTIIDIYARQWGSATAEERAAGHDVPIVGVTLSGSIPFSLPWVEAGVVSALINSQRGGAEYEQHAANYYPGMIGMATSFMDAQSSVHLYAVVLILLGAVVTLVTRARPTE
jgi:hypothetical protein